MTDPESAGDSSGGESSTDGGAADAQSRTGPTDGEAADPDIEALRAEVERKYDFDEFGPADMAKMTAEEWEAAFDDDSWVTGTELLDRIEAELQNRIARREVFAILERVGEGEGERVLAYSDEGYAVVYADGSLEGEGTVYRDVKPTLVLCSMPEFEVAEPPENYGLPSPDEVPEGTGELGNTVLQVVAVAQLLAGIALLGAYLLVDGLSTIVAPLAGVAFLLAGLFLLLVVANARLSDRFRTEEFRNRLRAIQYEDGERPPFVPEMPAEQSPADDGTEGETAESGTGSAGHETDSGDDVRGGGTGRGKRSDPAR
ncbi:MAG: hypothetical protein V5A46_09875 [Haloferacaceae archaeon]